MGITTTTRRSRRVVFAWLWAITVLVHTLFLPGSGALLSGVTMWNVTHLALAIAALVLVCRPRSDLWLAAVCIGVPVTAWVEAPRLGNHWLLASIVALAVLCSLVVGAIRHDDTDRTLEVDGFAAVRMVLLFAYGFFALSKFNSSFADPTVSCATLFVDQVAGSIGLGAVDAQSGAAWTHAVPIAVILIETSVVVLLALAPTRVLGVLVAMTFHGIISLDTAHSFSDFSSMIAALTVLFLPEQWFDDVAARLSGPRGRIAARIVTVVTVSAFAVLVTVQSLDEKRDWTATIGDAREALWWIIGAVVLIAVLVQLVRTRSMRADVALLPADRWMLTWPVLAVMIGLGPWLGVRTATSWNMYANLVTARGETNSWIVPGTLQLLDESSDLVRIVSTTDSFLKPYVRSGDLVPFVNLRLHTATARDAAIAYERAGSITVVESTRADPELGRSPGWVWEKVLTYRSVDLDGPATCQETMGALR